MKHSFLLLLTFVTFASNAFSQDKPRLIVLADMGNEPDEVQQIVHLLACCNEFEVEGLVAVTGKFLRPESNRPYRRTLHPELFHELIDAYEQVRPNLLMHAKGWPEPAALRAVTKSGQKGYGIADVGEGQSSPGSKLIVESMLRDDPRPLWIVVNAGSNTLAQALFELKNSLPANQLRRAIGKLRVFENGAQDNSGAWITSTFPSVHWIRSNYQTYAYGGPGGKSGNTHGGLGPHQWKPHEYSPDGQHAWAAKHVQNNHGALGAKYPDRRFRPDGPLAFIEGGGTIPWLGLVNKGLFHIDQPHWGGWGGRYSREKVPCFWSRHGDIRPDEELFSPFYTFREASDVWVNPDDGETYEGDYVPVWRFRPAMYADFQTRMDWCVKPYEQANHHPIAAVDADQRDSVIHMSATIGETLTFDASGSSDPDGDALSYRWWVYQESGTYPGRLVLQNQHTDQVSMKIPTGAGGKEIHLVMEVQDGNEVVPLTDYRRIVVTVSKAQPWEESPQNANKGRYKLNPLLRK